MIEEQTSVARSDIEGTPDSEANVENGRKKSTTEETWTDVNLNEEGDLNSRNMRNKTFNHVHGVDGEGNLQDNGRGEKPQQEISVVRIPAEYQSSHSTSSPEELAIKVRRNNGVFLGIFLRENVLVIFYFFFFRIWSIIFPFLRRQEKLLSLKSWKQLWDPFVHF